MNPWFNKKQLTDQTAHFLGAIVILAPILLFHYWFVAFYTGYAIGFVRELTQRGDPVTLTKAWDLLKENDWTGSALDMFFWGLGGLAAWFLFH